MPSTTLKRQVVKLFAVAILLATAAIVRVEAHECLVSGWTTSCGENWPGCNYICNYAYGGGGAGDCDDHVYGLAEDLDEHSCGAPLTYWEGDCQCDTTPAG